MLCGLGMGVPTNSKAEVHKDRGESPLEDSATVEVVGRVLKAKSSWRSRNEMEVCRETKQESIPFTHHSPPSLSISPKSQGTYSTLQEQITGSF